MTDTSPEYRPRSWATYAVGLAPVVLVWVALASWLAVLISDRVSLSEEADRASVREWLDEARTFRRTLPEMIREIVRAREAASADRTPLLLEELDTQLRAMTEPMRVYPNQLPTFPDVFRLSVTFEGGGAGETVTYESSVPRPRSKGEDPVRVIEYEPLGDGDRRAVVRCEYRVHALNKLQQREDDRQRRALLAMAVLAAATALAGLFVARFLRRERANDLARLEARAAAEHRERELAEARWHREETERELLRKRLDAKELEARAAAAEAAAADLRTHLFANIGIMAGSYAHNIKNLLVRPNDLLARCVEANGLSPTQAGMLAEVRGTLGTVTDRLHQILAAVRRDPTAAAFDPIDLNELVREAVATWADLGRDKWKLTLAAEIESGPLWVRADRSNVTQLLENLLFNARDATFERRNALREAARTRPDTDADRRRDRILAAAAWKGEVVVSTGREGDRAIVAVRDNGIGMTPEVKANCLTTHFTTKRDNALYEGHAAGMGLGLSFVAVVLETHGATLTIDTAPGEGTTFRMSFPVAGESPVDLAPAERS
jgi:signal transduction histidine kinase